MAELGFKSSKAEPDIWFRASKRKNEDDYYEYVLLYVEDCLVISDRVESLLKDEIGCHFVLKKSSIGPPSQYLVGKLRQVELENGTKEWAWGLYQYVQDVVKNIE